LCCHAGLASALMPQKYPGLPSLNILLGKLQKKITFAACIGPLNLPRT
jgi:hypothetical protein